MCSRYKLNTNNIKPGGWPAVRRSQPPQSTLSYSRKVCKKSRPVGWRRGSERSEPLSLNPTVDCREEIKEGSWWGEGVGGWGEVQILQGRKKDIKESSTYITDMVLHLKKK